MKIDAEKLKAGLQQLVSRSASAAQLAEVVQLSRVIIQAHLESHRQSVLRLSLQHGLTITDLAYDCIGEAFARGADGSFPQIQNFTASLHIPLLDAPAIDVFLAFKGFLVRVAEAQLARLYAQADPVGARIYRNIREHLKRSDAMKLERDFRGLVVRPINEDSLDHLDPFPLDRIERTLSGIVSQTIPELLQCLSKLLISQSEYRRSVPLFEIVGVLKRSVGSEYEYSIADNPAPGMEGMSKTEIETIRAQVETSLKERILLTYFARGKIDRKQAEAMASAFHDLLWDWCFGDDPKSLYGYLRIHLTLSETEYENTLRTKMEYLLRLARDEFAARLVKEL
jgi:hypothetical protein